MRVLLTYVVPLALIATLPAGVLLRDPGPTVVLTSIAAAVVAALVSTGVWRLGLRRYTGATS
jgi:ABC-2 type transport system permease protein